jgi:hypothetical protein
MSNDFFRNFAEFEREMLRPNRRQGQGVEDILDPDVFRREFLFDRDPFDEEEEEDDDD